MGAHGHLHMHSAAGASETKILNVSIGLIGTLLGGALLINSIIADYIFESEGAHSDIMAMIGALLLGLPVIWHAVKSLLEGHSHMDELVALAIIAAFAIGEYRVAGAVAFFMLIAELIEARNSPGCPRFN